MKLLVGLGNPGEKYEMTRHNAGFLALDMIAHTWQADAFSRRDVLHADIAKMRAQNKTVLLAKPTTFMNRSGSAVHALLDYYKLTSDDLIIVHDDKDFDLGEIRVANESSSAGHNGVQDIFDTLGTKGITRIRIGIGPKPDDIPTDAYVLSRFTPEELKELRNMESTIVKTLTEHIS